MVENVENVHKWRRDRLANQLNDRNVNLFNYRVAELKELVVAANQNVNSTDMPQLQHENKPAFSSGPPSAHFTLKSRSRMTSKLLAPPLFGGILLFRVLSIDLRYLVTEL